MGIAYQLTFFLALTLLAIVITIFVFAVSLLGRAIEAAAKSEKEKTTERKAKNAEEMAAIKEEIEKAVANGQIPKGLTRKLNKLEKRDKKFEKELSEIRRAPKLLTVKGGVVHPVGFLVGALILIGVAWGISEIQNPAPTILWILGLAAIVYSGIRIYRSLRMVESVAITSEEAALIREKEALKIALREHEEEKRPKLTLEFTDDQPPFHFEAGAQVTIEFNLVLTQGDIARKPEVYFFAPPGFEFPSLQTWLQDTDRKIAGGYITTVLRLNDIRKGISKPAKITIKAPSEKDSFILWYKLTCESLDAKLLEFQVIVE